MISEYEMKRNSRMMENEEKLKELGLTSLLTRATKKRKRRKSTKDTTANRPARRVSDRNAVPRFFVSYDGLDSSKKTTREECWQKGDASSDDDDSDMSDSGSDTECDDFSSSKRGGGKYSLSESMCQDVKQTRAHPLRRRKQAVDALRNEQEEAWLLQRKKATQRVLALVGSIRNNDETKQDDNGVESGIDRSKDSTVYHRLPELSDVSEHRAIRWSGLANNETCEVPSFPNFNPSHTGVPTPMFGESVLSARIAFGEHKATCPVCRGRFKPKGGTHVRRHTDINFGGICSGSGMPLSVHLRE